MASQSNVVEESKANHVFQGVLVESKPSQLHNRLIPLNPKVIQRGPKPIINHYNVLYKEGRELHPGMCFSMDSPRSEEHIKYLESSKNEVKSRLKGYFDEETLNAVASEVALHRYPDNTGPDAFLFELRDSPWLRWVCNPNSEKIDIDAVFIDATRSSELLNSMKIGSVKENVLRNAFKNVIQDSRWDVFDMLIEKFKQGLSDSPWLNNVIEDAFKKAIKNSRWDVFDKLIEKFNLELSESSCLNNEVRDDAFKNAIKNSRWDVFNKLITTFNLELSSLPKDLLEGAIKRAIDDQNYNMISKLSNGNLGRIDPKNLVVYALKHKPDFLLQKLEGRLTSESGAVNDLFDYIKDHLTEVMQSTELTFAGDIASDKEKILTSMVRNKYIKLTKRYMPDILQNIEAAYPEYRRRLRKYLAINALRMRTNDLEYIKAILPEGIGLSSASLRNEVAKAEFSPEVKDYVEKWAAFRIF
jgi:hypothetical protein